jgi:hypothetical protein
MWGAADQEMTKRMLLEGAWSAVVLGALGLASCEGCRSSVDMGVHVGVPAGGASSVAFAGPDATPTVRLYLLTDVAGALEPCGCTRDQLGGLNHFGAWVKHDTRPGTMGLVASAGPLFFMDGTLAPDHASQDEAKAETMAHVLQDLGLVAFAPGENDWAAGPLALASLATASGAAALAPGTPSPPFATTVIRRVAGPGGSSLIIGFVGVGRSAPAAPAAASAAPEPSAEDVVRRGVEEAKAQGANVLVALASVGRGEAKRIADAVPELAAVVVGSAKSAGDANTTAPPAERVGDVLIVQAANHLQSVAVLDLYVRDAPTPGHLVKLADATGLERAERRAELSRRIDDLHVRIAAWKQNGAVGAADVAARERDVAALEAERDALDTKPPPASGSFFRYALKEIRESLGQDPSIEARFVDYYRSVDEHNRVAFQDRLPPAAGPDEASYVGIAACSTCHPSERKFWEGTRHAHAYATLASQFKEYNLDCVGCHVTGYEKPGGSAVAHVDGLQNVQCEVCHGPGSRHVKSPSKATIVGSPAPSLCISCHHPPHVEGFDPVARMADILGPGHERAGR